ncbi:TPA: hypothetical protein DCE37_07785 [Candidatus Latescibacteria bacterium]|nr:hypothetical protein [Candidatus Latescibacterota bacterium]
MSYCAQRSSGGDPRGLVQLLERLIGLLENRQQDTPIVRSDVTEGQVHAGRSKVVTQTSLFALDAASRTIRSTILSPNDSNLVT